MPGQGFEQAQQSRYAVRASEGCPFWCMALGGMLAGVSPGACFLSCRVSCFASPPVLECNSPTCFCIGRVSFLVHGPGRDACRRVAWGLLPLLPSQLLRLTSCPGV